MFCCILNAVSGYHWQAAAESAAGAGAGAAQQAEEVDGFMVLDDVEVVVTAPSAPTATDAGAEQGSRKRGLDDVHIHEIADGEEEGGAKKVREG
jgi:hypothetical protein